MAVGALTPARAIRAPRRLDGRAVLGLFILLIATGGMLAAWGASNQSVAVLVAAHDLPAGAVLQPSDLTVARLHADGDVQRAALPASNQDRLIGKALADPVHAGEVLVQGQLATGPVLGSDQVAYAMPLGQDSVVAGIHPGDQVRVYVTLDKGKPDSKTVVVVDRATVRAVQQNAQLGLGSDSGSAQQAATPLRALTLIISNTDAERLAQAHWNGDLDVALLPPQQPASGH